MSMKWYALHTYSGFENKVKMNVEHLVTVEGYRDQFGQVLVPTENIVEIKKGNKTIVTKILMPGYVLVEMEPIEDLFNLIDKVPGVSSFVGDGVRPIALSEGEVANIIEQVETKTDKPKAEVKFRVGEQVKVIEGPFINFTGTVNEIEPVKQKLKVMVNILGRPTAVELDLLQVESL
jgi:transcriptional antiterminator NusG